MNNYEIIENFLEPIPFSDIKNTINQIFKDKKSKVLLGSESVQGGRGIGQFADPNRSFVGYKNVSDIANQWL